MPGWEQERCRGAKGYLRTRRAWRLPAAAAGSTWARGRRAAAAPKPLYRGPGAEATRVLRGGRDRDPPQPDPSFAPHVRFRGRQRTPPPLLPLPRHRLPGRDPPRSAQLRGRGRGRGRGAGRRRRSGERESGGASPNPQGRGGGPGFPSPPWTATGGSRVPGPERCGGGGER